MINGRSKVGDCFRRMCIFPEDSIKILCLQGIDRLIPVDFYIAGCPPRPEAVLDGLIELQNSIQNDGPLPTALLHCHQAKRSKSDQLNRYFEIPKKKKSLKIYKILKESHQQTGFTYSEDFINVSPILAMTLQECRKIKLLLKKNNGDYHLRNL
ncbi:MAG: hypothetical protein Ct9H300mP21_08510 [Pseudomonadota bacterium]|nr:MAG: hypothetical protein Ct9H300mP21_08510 [Pseudomonadota bacterium]